MKPALERSIEIFRDLGWDGAALADTPTLPLGSDAQQREARAGLTAGTWARFGKTGPNSYGMIREIPVDPGLLGIFAARVGVAPKRVAQVLPQIPGDLAAAILRPRGPDFLAAFVEATCRPNRWGHGAAAVRLVALHEAPVPENVEYLKTWTFLTARALSGQPPARGEDRIEPALLRASFRDHASAAARLGIPVTSPFEPPLAAGVSAGWITRAEALEVAFAGLDAARRPGDRKVWTAVLAGNLAVTDDELLAYLPIVTSALATAEAPLVDAFAPRLITRLEGEDLRDVLLAATLVGPQKSLRAVLKAAASRPAPAGVVIDAVAGTVRDLATSRHRAVVAAADGLLQAWRIDAASGAQEGWDGEPGRDPAGTGAGGAGTLCWRPTPAPRPADLFEVPDTSAEALTDAVARVLSRPSLPTVETEQLLALTHQLVRTDPDAARRALMGVPENWHDGARFLPAWVAGRDPRTDHGPSTYDLARAREAEVVARFADLPVLLSQPTWQDLRIAYPDLVARLGEYSRTGVDASASDLHLALLRLDLTTVDGDPAGRSAVRVVRMNGESMPRSAGEYLSGYLADPVLEPTIEVTGTGRFRRRELGSASHPPSLRDFPEARVGHLHALHPSWVLAGYFTEYSDYPEPTLGALMRQLVRADAPMSGSVAVNLLGALRGPHPQALEDAHEAVALAWERGHLVPAGLVAGDLDWHLDEVRQLAAFARVLAGQAEQGLASVVWPLADDLVAEVGTGRLPAGISDLVDLLRDLIPVARSAVERGIADEGIFSLPGLRALAARTGSSLAVRAAREAVALLPPPVADPAHASVPTGGSPAPTAASPAGHAGSAEADRLTWVGDVVGSWERGCASRPEVLDTAEIAVTMLEAGKKTEVHVDLTVPAHTRPLRVNRWFYGLVHDGILATREPAPSAGSTLFVRWDADRADFAVSEIRGEGGSGQPSPVTVTLLAALLAYAADGSYGAVGDEHGLREVCEKDLVGSRGVAHAARVLMRQPAISPARLAGLAGRNLELVPWLWPLLSEPIAAAAEIDELPRWLNGVLDNATKADPLLRAGVAAGKLPPTCLEWRGLSLIADRRGASAALRKARALRDAGANG